MMLEVENINVYYGAIHALRDVGFHVDEGEIVTLIGANGAGKSTTLKTFLGKDITQTPAEEIVRMGIIHTPEGRKIFAPLTVQENLEMGAFLQNDKGQIEKDLEDVYKRFPRLNERRSQPGGTLSGGEQQMLAMARSLMGHPKLILLDEPSMGLAPILVEQIFDIVREINKQGTSILLVEQNAKMALSIADRAYVLETGTVVLQGDAKDVMEDPMVVEAYLGG